MAAFRAEAERAAKEAIAAIWFETGKAANDEFEAGFFQGYLELNGRVALAHPEWDLSAFSGVDSDYWDIEASADEGDHVAKVGTGAVGGTGGSQAASGTEEEDLVVVDDPPRLTSYCKYILHFFVG